MNIAGHAHAVHRSQAGAPAGPHRDRRPRRSRQIDADRPAAARDRQPAGRQTGSAEGGQRAARHAVRMVVPARRAADRARPGHHASTPARSASAPPSRDIVLIDAPGHAEFLRNMITGAAQADAALLIIDAAEGVRDQTRRHGYLLHLLGIHQVAVVINKMDRVDFDAQRFHEIEAEIVEHLAGLGLSATAIIPISARHGDGVAQRDAADRVAHRPDRAGGARPLRAGAARDRACRCASRCRRSTSSTIGASSPAASRAAHRGRRRNRRHAARQGGRACRSIEAWPVPDELRAPREALAGQSIGITLDRRAVRRPRRPDLRGRRAVPERPRRGCARACSGCTKAPLSVGDAVTVRIGTAESRGVIAPIDHAVDPGQAGLEMAATIGAEPRRRNRDRAGAADRGRPQRANPRTGRVVLEFDGRIAGGGLVLRPTRRQSRPARAPQALAARLNRRPHASRCALRRFAGRAHRALPPRDRRPDRVHHQLRTGRPGHHAPAVARQNIDVEIVTLDTGRLFPRPTRCGRETERRYGRRIRAFYPSHADLEALVARQGINGFYEFTRGAARLLPRAQGRAAQSRARRRARLDHRPARRAIGAPRSVWRW